MRRVDAVIVGGGPAGLSAALMLGRCRRDVVLIDAGEQRNLAAAASHAFLTRDGIAPAELVRLARAEVASYPTIELCRGTVTEVTGARGAFRVCCAEGMTIEARRLLLATGVVDEVPDVPGVRELYGRSVHHCAHCDAYEYADQPVAVYGRGEGRVDAALTLMGWTGDVTLLTDGEALDEAEAQRCADAGIAVCDERVVGLEGSERLERVVLASGAHLSPAAVFLAVSQRQRCDLAARLGCEFTPLGAVMTDEYETTCVPGLYVAGDASHREQMIAVAAAEGLLAAVKIHESLWGEERTAKGI